jgi:hypothetical protein
MGWRGSCPGTTSCTDWTVRLRLNSASRTPARAVIKRARQHGDPLTFGSGRVAEGQTLQRVRPRAIEGAREADLIVVALENPVGAHRP